MAWADPDGDLTHQLPPRVVTLGGALSTRGQIPPPPRTSCHTIRGHSMNADQAPSPRNLLGAVTFVIVALGALLAVIPATAAFGALLCFLALFPAIVSFRRARHGVATNRRLSVTALVLAPVFFIVALNVGAATAPSLTHGSTGAPQTLPALPNPASTPARQQSPAPAAPAAPAAAPVEAPPEPAQRTAPLAPARSPEPATPAAPQTAPSKGSACDESTHYVNSDGACVPRPMAATAPPPGATARCVDGEYSFSKHRRGTCSGHGGVAQWL